MKQYLTKTIFATFIILASLVSCKKDVPFADNTNTYTKDLAGKFSTGASSPNPNASITTTQTIFDNLNIVSPPVNGVLFGFQEKATDGQAAAFQKVGFIDNFSFGKPLILNNSNALQSLQFVKAGSLAVSGKPFYYMKLSSFSLTMLLDGVYLLDDAHTVENFRRWVFEPAPATPGVKANNYYIYNMGFAGALMRLQVRWSDKVSAPNTIINPAVYLTNYLGVGSTATVGTQVFSIRP